ncbi:ArsA-related P-loop ATPase [Gordonia sp. NPDC062954]|uniref:ArsA family ATPase n=1 Tax=unclassified Gordonia (in: high G+C Gram-positive bacteria) TaxID=2657482 RepID=UPI000C43CC27|nr:ArsA-related P-loop ATPase [Gordonia sp. (in: high G+C Gram-positive bacteria)]MAU81177.1 chromosome partitioning protein ParA [Gordonia sp. (in: high G+C Gram-positive bacteria)]
MVIGPGGAGVSVAAASGALGRARGQRAGPRTRGAGSGLVPEQDTLLITVDRWSPTAELFGVYRTSAEPVAVSSRLHLLSLDRLGLVERSWSDFTAVLSETVARSRVSLPGLGVASEISAGELAALPGIEDFLLLRRIRDEAAGGTWRRIVVDVSGLGDPFEFLRAASVLSQALNRLWPRHRRLAAAAERPVLAQVTAAVDAIDRDCVDIAELTTDAHSVAVHLVIGTDGRAERLLPALLANVDVMGLALRSVIVNRGVGDGCDRRVARLRSVVHDDRDVEVINVDRVDEPIDRAARLRKVGVTFARPDGRRCGTGAARVAEVGADDGSETVRGQDRVYELTWRQRLPEPDTLQLGRFGDDLLVTVGGFRHPVRLPSVLRRCVVVDAAWDGTELVVRFVPDPKLWPKGR